MADSWTLNVSFEGVCVFFTDWQSVVANTIAVPVNGRTPPHQQVLPHFAKLEFDNIDDVVSPTKPLNPYELNIQQLEVRENGNPLTVDTAVPHGDGFLSYPHLRQVHDFPNPNTPKQGVIEANMLNDACAARISLIGGSIRTEVPTQYAWEFVEFPATTNPHLPNFFATRVVWERQIMAQTAEIRIHRPGTPGRIETAIEIQPKNGTSVDVTLKNLEPVETPPGGNIRNDAFDFLLAYELFDGTPTRKFYLKERHNHPPRGVNDLSRLAQLAQGTTISSRALRSFQLPCVGGCTC